MSANVSLLEIVLAKVGLSIWVSVDRVFLLNFIPSILGIVSELAVFLVFCQIKIGSPLYTYLKGYTINSIVVCCCFLTMYLGTIYSLGNTRALKVYSVLFVYPLLAGCYVYSTLLDIVILLDRISVFNKRVKHVLKLISPFKQIILLALISLILNIPYFFLLIEQSISFNATNSTKVTIWYINKNPICDTQTGYALLMFIITVNYGLIMLIQITLNIISAVYIRRHMKQKATRVGTTHAQGGSRKKVDVRTGIMVTILCSLSFAEHVIIIFWTATFFSILKSSVGWALIQLIAIFILAIRRCGDFLFFFTFNKVFKKQFYESARLTNVTDVTTLNRSSNR